MSLILSLLFMVVCAIPASAEIIDSYEDSNGFDCTKWKEDNGFIWIEVEDSNNNRTGAMNRAGETIIPLSRNYEKIYFLTEENHPDGGYFNVGKNGFEGAVDIRGKEIVAPDKFHNIIWIDGHYEGQVDDTSDWLPASPSIR